MPNTLTQKTAAKRKDWLYRLVFLLGLLFLLYPLVSHLYYQVQFKQEISRFEAQSNQLTDTDLRRRFDLARAYNQTLDPSKVVDPYYSDEEKAGLAEYARMLEVNEQVGYVHVPSIETKLPIYAGTSHQVLERGAGHLEGTSLPIGGANTHAVITAHRGLPTANLFTDLDKVALGDVFYVQNIAETLAYQVDQIMVVEPSDFKHIRVVEGQDYVTLLTCTPYTVNSHRLLVRGRRVDLPEASARQETPRFFISQRLVEYLTMMVVLLLGLLFFALLRRKRKESASKSGKG